MAEVLNIYPVKTSEVQLDIVIPAMYVRLHKTKQGQTVLSTKDSRIIALIQEYLDSKGLDLGHESFLNHVEWCFPSHYEVKTSEVLPKGCGLIRMQAIVEVVKDWKSAVVDVDNDYPIEHTYITKELNGKKVFSY